MTISQKEEVSCIDKRRKYVFNTLLALGIITTSLLTIANGFALSKEFSRSGGDRIKAIAFFICSIVIWILLLGLVVFKEKQIISESKIKQDRVEDKIKSIQESEESIKLEGEDLVEYEDSLHFELSQVSGKLYASTPKKNDEPRVSWKESRIISEHRGMLEDALDMTKRELKKVKEEVEEKRISLTKLKKGIEEMKGQLSGLEEKIEKEEQEIKEKENELNKLKEDIEEENSNFGKLNKGIQVAENELSKLSEKIKEKEGKLGELEKKIKILEGEKDALDEVFKRKEGARKRLDTSLEERKKVRKTLDESFEIKRGAKKRLDDSFDRKKKQKEELDASFEKKKEQKEKLNTNIRLPKEKVCECIAGDLDNENFKSLTTLGC
ncbi:hypothetical protein [Candidatus Mesenet endosymbiont of Phosphuga atrata]|uniref:hypothetical protein n=1 Tax=Candidatus Mesenet endosymbiont of Phosphuga atrata TaxID=3066221 RepID=UPI0030D54DC1